MPAKKESQSRVRITGSRGNVHRFLKANPLEPQSVRVVGEDTSFEAFVSDREQVEARRAGLRIEVIFDSNSLLAQRPDISRGNRFADGSIPRGAGRPVRR